MKSETLFDKILCIDTLLSLDGVIPSLSYFRSKLASLIEAFYSELLKEQLPEHQAQTLCQVVCKYLDQKITTSLGDGLISWNGHSLDSYFYGYEESELSVAIQFRELLAINNDKIHNYVMQLVPLVALLNTGVRDIEELMTEVTPLQSHKNDSASASIPNRVKQVIFILGPFATSWFREPGNDAAVRFDNETVWLLAPTPQVLKDRLNSINSDGGETQISAFFPLLPDAVEDAAVMHARLVAWFNSFAALRLAAPLNCTLGLYGRFSNERSAHDPDKALWVGDFANGCRNDLTFDEAGEYLLAYAKEPITGVSRFTVQRKVMTKALLAWLHESGLSNALQQLFATLPFYLNGMLLADYGNGFTRHGAWSHWLENNYGMLPGLSASLMMPPLPALPLIRPAGLASMSSCPPASYALSQRAKKRPFFSPLLLCLLVMSVALLALWWVKNGLPRPVERLIADTNTSPVALSHLPAAMLVVSAFPSGSARLTPQQMQDLTQFIPRLSERKTAKFLIIGYSDNTGTTGENLKISGQRALSVRDWIVQHSLLPETQFQTIGMGDAFPAASNEQQISRATNRRVEIIPLE